MFVWVFHRISGVLLIFFLAFQLLTGFFQASLSNSELIKTMADLHRHTAVNFVMVFLVIFHALYGIRTILLDMGVKHEKRLDWSVNALGTVLYAVFVVLYLRLVAV